MCQALFGALRNKGNKIEKNLCPHEAYILVRNIAMGAQSVTQKSH